MSSLASALLMNSLKPKDSAALSCLTNSSRSPSFTNLDAGLDSATLINPSAINSSKKLCKQVLIGEQPNTLTAPDGPTVPICLKASPSIASSFAAAAAATSQFIDPLELKKKLFNFQSKFIILLDCRTYNDFNNVHIKDSVHVNCRDKITKKRLQSRKISVKDLIASEEIKNKFDLEPTSFVSIVANSASKLITKMTCSLANTALAMEEYEQINKENINSNSNSISSSSSSSVLANNDNIIVLYDDTTCSLQDLQAESNPLKIVHENIKQSGIKKECKILKGGFKQFMQMCPEFCVNKSTQSDNKINLGAPLSKVNNLKYCDDQHQSAIDNAIMNEIVPNLYLGNEIDAKDLEKLKQNNIYYILNVTKNIQFYCDHEINNFVCKRIAVDDMTNQNLKQHFDEAIKFIDEGIDNNKKVLVHCQAGISRSPTIVIAYLMYKYNLSMNDAYSKVKDIRPIVAPNLIFMSQLMDYEAKLNAKESNVNKINTHECTSISNNSTNSSTNTSNVAIITKSVITKQDSSSSNDSCLSSSSSSSSSSTPNLPFLIDYTQNSCMNEKKAIECI